jgi:hypothetical protein
MKLKTVLLAAALLLTACGGGADECEPITLADPARACKEAAK